MKTPKDDDLRPQEAKSKRRRRNKGMCLEDRPVLEPNAAGIDVRDSRTTRHPPLFAECPPHEERTRVAHRLARVPMVTVPALSGITVVCISAWAGHLRRANRDAAP